MKFFGQNDNEINNLFSEALLQYHNDLNNGNYETIEGYTIDNYGWADKDELDILENTLKPLLLLLPIEGINSTNLRAMFELDLPIGLPKIADLLATINILKEQAQVQPAEELRQLEEISEVSLQVEAAIPGPCLAYLGALRYSNLDIQSKFLSVNSIIIRTLSNLNKFDILDQIVLRVAMVDWLNGLHQLEPEIQERFADKIKEYTEQVNACYTINEIKEKLTLVEKYIVLSLEKLNNRIGEIYLTEFSQENAIRPA